MSEAQDISPETTSPEELRELRAVSALLRALPDPEPPAGLYERIMSEATAREARPRVLRGLFRRVASPAVVSALAAGLATVAVVTAIRQEAPAPEAPLLPMRAHRVVDGAATPTPHPALAAAAAPSMPGVYVRPVSLFGADASPDAIEDLEDTVVRAANALDLRLDHQINRLLLDPISFYQQVERARDRDLLIQRLSDRAGKRGDAAEIALQLRTRAQDHPLTDRFIDHLLHAALIEYIANR